MLLRTIEATMPRDTLLNIVKPRSAEVEGFLVRNQTGPSRQEEGDYYLALEGGALSELAALVDAIAPEPACGGLFVSRGEINLLEAYRRDAGEEVVWLSSTLPPDTLDRIRALLENSGPAAARTQEPAPASIPRMRSA
jgi:hypothetical protein